IDPKAKVSADILVPDWVKIRDQMPVLYKGLDVGLAHYYPMTDYRGWNDLYISDLVDHLSNPTGRESTAMKTYESKKQLKDFGEYDAKSLSFDHPWYAGSWGWLDKEVWVTEISSHGYWRWGNLTPENKRAADWQKVVDAIAGAKNRVTRIYHHCFRDKMNSREFGMGQSGIVYYDGSPRPATLAFRKMAVKYSPAKSPLRILSCDIKRSAVNPNSNIANVTITLANKTAKPIRGEAVLELPKGASADAAKLNFSIPPMKSETWIAKIDAANMKWGNNHVFAKVKIPQGLAYGWGIIAKPKRLELNPAPGNTSEGVRYAQGIEAVQEFFDKYGDDCAIITGPCLGDDAEMGYRLKIVMQSMRCGEIPVRPSILAAEVLNRPIIVIGTSEYNLISKTIEMALPEDQKITMANPGKGRGIISVIKQPFGEAQEEGRFSRQSTQIGYYFGSCPAALYIAGTDDAGTRAAVYDLIRRIWGNDNKY
ncbi:MAG: hypothetical protein Q7N50_09345, partial [Armatimonadota bacterium]|nr:hypothetical protein [Armatimonadota bacterium]